MSVSQPINATMDGDILSKRSHYDSALCFVLCSDGHAVDGVNLISGEFQDCVRCCHCNCVTLHGTA